jgi:cell division protein FtsW (lipid II flippase)
MLADEPLRPHDPVDWRYLYSLILERTEREEDRGKLLDAKVTSLLGGVVAFIGFSFRVNVSAWSSGAALLYIIPLAFLLSALLADRGESAPTAKSLHRYFSAFPVSTLKESTDAMLIANALNESANDRRAARADLATILTGIVTVLVLITQFWLALAVHDLGTAGIQTNSAVPAAAHRVGTTRSNTHP